MDLLRQIRETADPITRVRLATEALATYQEAVTELGTIRKAAVQELRAQGLSLTQIAEQAGISRGRLSQLGLARPAPERALLTSTDSVIVAVPEEDAPYAQGAATRATVHKDDLRFIDQITELANRFGLGVSTEYIRQGEFINLNRPGLVVTCGPRQSPWLEQNLTADTTYGFARDDTGWYLEDKTTAAKYRSPEDSGQPSDYGYLGILPRPDGQGTWLYAAGIHAAGSRGAATYLSDNIAQIYSDTKGYYWSCLIECSFNRKTRDVTSTSLLAPIQRRGVRRGR